MLPEVLAAETRVDAPDAARRKEYERRVKGEPPPLSPEDMHKYQSSLHMVRAPVAWPLPSFEGDTASTSLPCT